MSLRISTRTALAVTVLSAFGLPAAAQAQERPVIVQGLPEAMPSERVSYASLDLATAKGLKTLNFRVAGAIERVCQIDLGRDGLQDKDFYACQSLAWDDASSQIDRAAARARQVALGGALPVAAMSILVSAR